MLETLEGPRHPVGSVGYPHELFRYGRGHRDAALVGPRQRLADGLVAPFIVAIADGGGVR
jgi:hypothetical protein